MGGGANQSIANQLAEHQAMFGDWRELFRSVDKMDQVTKADIRRVAAKTFVDTNRTVGILESTSSRSPSAGM
jgi:predicted Zn-dependent peptidase